MMSLCVGNHWQQMQEKLVTEMRAKPMYVYRNEENEER